MPTAAFTQLHKQKKSKDCLSFHIIAQRKLESSWLSRLNSCMYTHAHTHAHSCTHFNSCLHVLQGVLACVCAGLALNIASSWMCASCPMCASTCTCRENGGTGVPGCMGACMICWGGICGGV